MHRRVGRPHDRRRLGMLAAVFFVVGVADLAGAIEMSSWWMVVAGMSCAVVASSLLVLRHRVANRPVRRS